MFSKLRFNNLVITNKKLIQRGRAQTVAKVVKKLRKINEDLKKKPDDKQLKECMRRNVELLSHLKMQKEANIMRTLLLLQGTNLNGVLTNGLATPDEKAIAMLGLNKLINGLVEEFRKSLELNENANTKWREEIMELSKRRIKLDRTEQKRRKRKELKDSKAQTRNRLEWLQDNQPAVNTPAEPEAAKIKTAAGICMVYPGVQQIDTDNLQKNDNSNATGQRSNEQENKQTKNKQNITTKSMKPSEVNLKTDVQKPTRVQDQNKDTSKNAGQPDNTIESKQTPKQPFLSIILSKADKRQNKPKTELGKKLNQDQERIKRKEVKKVAKVRPTHVEDPFFITESGKPYLSTAVVLSGDSSSESDNDEANTHPKKRARLQNPKEYNTNVRGMGRRPLPIATSQKLPSSSNNKRITFDDQGTASRIINPVTVQAPTPSTEAMHPSWLAKQKLKPKIATFTGTKIKFDD